MQRLVWSWSRAQYLITIGDNDRALQVNRQALPFASLHGLSFAGTMSRSYEIWALLSMGDATAASNILETVGSDFNHTRRNDAAIYHFLTSWAALLRDCPRTALDHAELAANLAAQLGHAGPAICTLGALSQALANCGELARALAVASQAQRWIKGLDAGMYRISALLPTCCGAWTDAKNFWIRLPRRSPLGVAAATSTACCGCQR